MNTGAITMRRRVNLFGVFMHRSIYRDAGGVSIGITDCAIQPHCDSRGQIKRLCASGGGMTVLARTKQFTPWPIMWRLSLTTVANAARCRRSRPSVADVIKIAPADAAPEKRLLRGTIVPPTFFPSDRAITAESLPIAACVGMSVWLRSVALEKCTQIKNPDRWSTCLGGRY